MVGQKLIILGADSEDDWLEGSISKDVTVDCVGDQKLNPIENIKEIGPPQ